MPAPLVELRHRTVYRWTRPSLLGPHTIRLHPSPASQSRVSAYALTVRPEPLSLHWFADPLANRLARVSFGDPVEQLEIVVSLTADLSDLNPYDFVLDADAADWPFAYPISLERDLSPYRELVALRPWLAGLISGLDLSRRPTVGLLTDLAAIVRSRIAYLTREEAGVQEPAQTVERGSGSCRDMAWLLVLLARSLGFAARFVSGYLVQLADPAGDGPDRDSADLHAWAEIFLPGAGWLGLDATSSLATGSGHIALASGAHPIAAAPVEGTAAEAGSLDTTLTVQRA